MIDGSYSQSNRDGRQDSWQKGAGPPGPRSGVVCGDGAMLSVIGSNPSASSTLGDWDVWWGTPSRDRLLTFGLND